MRPVIFSRRVDAEAMAAEPRLVVGFAAPAVPR